MKSIVKKNRWTRFALCFLTVLIVCSLLPTVYATTEILPTNIDNNQNKIQELLKVIILTIVIVSAAGGFGAFLATRKSKK